MKAITLLLHGERIRPEYEPMPGETEGAEGASTDEQRPDGQASGIVKRFKKHEEATYNAQALSWIKAVYPDAIEYTALTKELQGMAFWWGIFFALAMSIALGLTFHLSLASKLDLDSPVWIGWFASLAVGGAFAAYMLTFGLRMTLWQPSDLPIIFDRRHRKVYRILREQAPGFIGMFKPWPIKACEYEWDLIDAEHEAEIFTTGGTVMRNHYLMFVVRKSAHDPTIIDSFQIANAFALSEELVPCMWEHIRRFMEANGPHLPSRNEPLASQDAPPGWWQSCGAVGVFGAGWRQKWHDQPIQTFMFHLLFPLFLPMNLLWGTGNWLHYKTRMRVEWPDEVKQSVGAAIAQ